MCFHWQQRAANDKYDQLKNATKSTVQALIDEEKERLHAKEMQAIDYHGSLENCKHGFFAGAIFGSQVMISMLKHKLGELEHGE